MQPNASAASTNVVKIDRLLKREQRKQSNREAAKRSRLRKQTEHEELLTRFEALKNENQLLQDEVKRLSDECAKLSSENTSLDEKCNSLGL